MGLNRHSLLTSDYTLQTVQALTEVTRFCVAYSGGVDSHVLLDLLVCACKAFPQYELSAVHVHHGISVQADAWARHCQTVCAALQIPLTLLHVDGKVVNGRSPEEVAREARFLAFKNFLTEEQCLLLAHHAADQTETILWRLFRGTGPLGLGGMSAKATLGNHDLIRPLLNCSKEAILEYAVQRQLSWIEDDSNIENRFDRNYLRNEIIPALKLRWPSVERSVNRAGALCVETATLAQTFAKEDLKGVRGRGEDCLSVSRLLALDSVRRRAVIRVWLQALGFALPSWDHMERIEREVLKAKPGAKPRLKISIYEIRRLKDELFVLRAGIGYT